MKYLAIAILGCMIGYGYGYVKGYDEAKECYTSFYETLIKRFYDYEKERID